MNINNISNKIKQALMLCAAIGLLYSCDDFVQELPVSEISPDGFYSNNAELESGIIGAYDGLQVAYSQFYLNVGEFRSDNFQPNGNNTSRNSLHNSTIDPGEGLLRWANLYTVIDRVNRVINAGPNIDGVDKDLLGEAYAMRAKIYFDLARVWGDVPVFLQSITAISETQKPQTSYEDVMNTVVIPDMKKAEELITTPSREFRFSQASVFALQAEVYMWIKEEGLAKDAIENLIALGSHSLVQTPEAWQDLFINQPSTAEFPQGPGKVQAGPELIFSVHYALEETTSGVARAYMAGAAISVMSEEAETKWAERFPIDSLGWADKYTATNRRLPVFTREIELDDGSTIIEPIYGDWRQFATRFGGDFEDGLGSDEFGEARCAKWVKNRSHLNPNDDDTNLPVYRYADMILLLAEAELKLQNAPKCLELINQVRTARQLPLATDEEFGDNFDAQLDFLLVERQLELFGEGKRWWDLVRNDRAIDVMNPILEEREVTPLTSDRIIWPIFIDHLRENPLLNQNPGWLN